MDERLDERNGSVRELVSSDKCVYFQDQEMDAQFRDWLGKFLDKWHGDPSWDLDYENEALGNYVEGGVAEHVFLCAHGSFVEVYRHNNGVISWNYQMYNSRSVHLIMRITAAALAVTDKKLLIERIFGIFEKMMDLFTTEDLICSQVCEAEDKVSGDD
jgi:hypothetical protein